MTKRTFSEWLHYKIGLYITLFMPRDSIVFSKKYFKNKSITALEIGVDRAINSLSILRNLNVHKMYLVDPYIEYEDYLNSEDYKTQEHLTKCEKIARRRLRKYDNLVWIKKYSDAALKEIPDNLDFVYIDGNHEEPYVLADMENYYKKLRNGGLLAGHDICTFPGVMRAFCEFVVEHKIKFFRITKTDWYLIK